MINAKLFNKVLGTKKLAVAVAASQVKLNMADGESKLIKYNGFMAQIGKRKDAVEAFQAADGWVEVPTTQPKSGTRKLNYAFKNEEDGSHVFIRAAIMVNGYRCTRTLSLTNANVYYVEGKSPLLKFWVLGGDLADQKAAASAKRAAKKENEQAKDKSWVNSCLFEKVGAVPSLATSKLSLWGDLMPHVQANTRLWKFGEMIAKKTRNMTDDMYLARQGLKADKMTEELTELFLNSTADAIMAIAKAAKLKVVRDGVTMVLSNKHTYETIRLIPGRFVGNTTYIKVGP
jgi:hypothetical protein